MMKKERAIQIVRLQENLSSIRKIARWTAEDLGEMLGVTKQNISNLENGNTKLSQAQYIAIRHLIDYWAVQKQKNPTLIRVVGLLVDRTELQGKDYNSLVYTARNISAAAATMDNRALAVFAEALIKDCYTRISDFTEIEGTLKDVCESKETQDWTADIVITNNGEDNIG